MINLFYKFESIVFHEDNRNLNYSVRDCIISVYQIESLHDCRTWDFPALKEYSEPPVVCKIITKSGETIYAKGKVENIWKEIQDGINKS